MSGHTAEPGALGEHQREVLERVAVAERALAATMPTDDPRDAKRRFRVQATRAEFLAQPEMVARNWAAQADRLPDIAQRVARHDIDRAYLVGAGDSLAVMAAARLALETMLGVPSEPVQCLEFAYYQGQMVTPRSLVVALSSSGETTRTVEALMVAQQAGALTIALTNRPGSTLDAESSIPILLDATRVGWPTQSSTVPLAVLLRLAALVGIERGISSGETVLAELDRVPELMEQTIRSADPAIEHQAATEAGGDMYLFSGAGPNWASATVGAAKVKECTPDHAVALELEEYHHFNSQKAGEPLWLLSPASRTVERSLDTIREAERLGGHVHVVTADETPFRGAARSVLVLPPITEMLSPLLYFLPAQLVGYHLAQAKFAVADAVEA